jgi:zinc transporter, ZIP family
MVADLSSIAVSLLWGFVVSIPLLLGCLLALTTKLSKKTIAVIMAFGSGVLVASLAFSLIEEAFEMSQSIPSVIIGFISGGLAYTIANYYLTNVHPKAISDTERNLMGLMWVAEMPPVWPY